MFKYTYALKQNEQYCWNCLNTVKENAQRYTITFISLKCSCHFVSHIYIGMYFRRKKIILFLKKNLPFWQMSSTYSKKKISITFEEHENVSLNGFLFKSRIVFWTKLPNESRRVLKRVLNCKIDTSCRGIKEKPVITVETQS